MTNIVSARVLVMDASYNEADRAVAEVIERLDLGSWLGGLRGKRVFIKPNMLGLFEPEKHVTTHPSLVRALVRLFRSVGAEVTVGDNCGAGSYGMTERVGKKTGIAEASEGAFVNVAKDSIERSLDSKYMKSVVVSRAMMEADVLVSAPKLKTHSLTLLTGAVKNSFGFVAGGSKGCAHASAPTPQHFGRLLSEIFALRPPDLTIMDAIVCMEGNGPSSGTLKKVGRVMASTNAVALDASACRMMGVAPEKVRHLRRAHRLGYGPIAAEAIELIGTLPEARFKLPRTAGGLGPVMRVVNQGFFGRLSREKLSLNEKKCKRCKLCVDGCPTGAMNFDKFPSIDHNKCIRCFCCFELCPESAWELRGPLSRLLRRG